MSHDHPVILGVESSCDETAAAVVENGVRVRSNVIATQHELHEQYAGVVPEIASRAHLERIHGVLEEAVRAAGLTLVDLDAIAVGHRPGLIGSLLVGVSAAKALAWALGKPLIGVDHIHAHLHAGLLDAGPAAFPALGLVVSGGHTSLFHMTDGLDMRLLGRTIDDAIGEAFDKAATILKLGYPGGPAIDRIANDGNDRAHDLPIPRLKRGRLDFSYSGLKTALLYRVCGQPVRDSDGDTRLPKDASAYTKQEIADFAASFQRVAVKGITIKLREALETHPDLKTLLVGGGVSANSRLRSELAKLADEHELDLRLPPMAYCLDNAAMIAGLAAEKLRRGRTDDLSLTAAARSVV
jgi:N6-L-threonylcarbamoyladenine synthase